MKFRVINKKNLNAKMLFPTYFKTKKDAKLYAENLGNNALIQKKIGYEWVEC